MRECIAHTHTHNFIELYERDKKTEKKSFFPSFEFGWVVSACKQQPICKCEVFLYFRFIFGFGFVWWIWSVHCALLLPIPFVYCICYCTDSYLIFTSSSPGNRKLVQRCILDGNPAHNWNGRMILISIFLKFLLPIRRLMQEIKFPNIQSQLIEDGRLQATTATAKFNHFCFEVFLIAFHYEVRTHLFMIHDSWVIKWNRLKTKVFIEM